MVSFLAYPNLFGIKGFVCYCLLFILILHKCTGQGSVLNSLSPSLSPVLSFPYCDQNVLSQDFTLNYYLEKMADHKCRQNCQQFTEDDVLTGFPHKKKIEEWDNCKRWKTLGSGADPVISRGARAPPGF
jgi:hypothetical protein